MIDVSGKRLVRVGDVVLDPAVSPPQLVGVELGERPVFRRLALRQVAERHPEDVLDWADLHIASSPGHFVPIPGIPLLGVLFLTQALNAFLLVPLLIFMFRISRDREVMGDYANGRTSSVVAGVAIALITGCVLALVLAPFL